MQYKSHLVLLPVLRQARLPVTTLAVTTSSQFSELEKAGMHKEPAKRNALPPEQDQSGKEETLVTRRHIVSRDRGVTGIVTSPLT